MRSLGIVLVGAGLFGWLWSSQQLERLDPYPKEMDAFEAVENYPAARMELMRYACAFGGVVGLLLLAVPKS